MKVICIDNKISTMGLYDLKINTKNVPTYALFLTIGKIYDGDFNEDKSRVCLINDKGNKVFYDNKRFITLEECRDKILNNLLK